jgi:prepilin-type N-terminal cleavage/methylation domain-containing protein/prepilin-type processing-associated H-X9-DG protein
MPLEIRPFEKRFRLKPSARAFTLIELLTVVAIIGILAAIVIPTVGKIRAGARSSQSVSNLRQLAQTVRLYSQENKGALVPGRYVDGIERNWISALWPYGVPGQPLSLTHQKNSIFFAPGWDSSSAYNADDFWKQGYAMNGVPGLPAQWQLNWATGDIPVPEWQIRYRLDSIENPSRRLLFVESNEWHLDAGNISTTGVDLDRHGSKGVNIAYFDGHVGKSSDLEAINRMVANP